MIKTKITVERVNSKGEKSIKSILWQDLTGFCGEVALTLKEGALVKNKVVHQSLSWDEKND